MTIVNSYGGAATTIFIDHFSNQGVIIPIKEYTGVAIEINRPVAQQTVFKHTPQPPDESDKAVYIFSDPVEAVMSFFRRRSEGYNRTMRGLGTPVKDWVVGHCKNIGGDYTQMNKDWDLTSYLEQGEELLGLERHFDNWSSARRSYPILLVKYEKMWEHLEAIHDFMECPGAVADFPQKRTRGSSLDNLNAKDKNNILKMYGTLREKISLAPDISETPPRDQ